MVVLFLVVSDVRETVGAERVGGVGESAAPQLAQNRALERFECPF